MAWKDRYSRPGPGIPKDAPKKKGLRLFFDIVRREFFELVKLNLLFLLFCIPVATIPAALTAMSRITVKMIRDEPHFLWGDFWETFKSEFLPSTLGGGALLLALAASGVGASFYGRATGNSYFFAAPMAVTVVFGMTALMSCFYFFPMRALVDLPLKQTLKNALLLSCACPGPNLAAAAILIVCVFLLAVYFFLAVPVILLFAASFLNLVCTFAAYGGLAKYVIAEAPRLPPV